MQPALISASILAADLARLGDDVEAVLDAGADWVHVDVMDNHYVPNLSLGPPVIAALHRAVPQAVLDVHLMVKPVDALVAECAAAGAAVITVHPEATEHLDRTLALIHDHGCMAGLSLNPATPLHWLDHVLDRLDLLLLMSVNPGFGGQSFIDSALPKIEAARARIDAAGRPIRLEVDGGIKAGNIDAVAHAGADTFVAGSAIFGSDDYRATIDAMRAALSGAGRDAAPTSRSA